MDISISTLYFSSQFTKLNISETFNLFHFLNSGGMRRAFVFQVELSFPIFQVTIISFSFVRTFRSKLLSPVSLHKLIFMVIHCLHCIKYYAISPQASGLRFWWLTFLVEFKLFPLNRFAFSPYKHQNKKNSHKKKTYHPSLPIGRKGSSP